MSMMSAKAAIREMDQLGADRIPFFFFTDFLATKAYVAPLSDVSPQEVQFAVGLHSNVRTPASRREPILLEVYPIDFKGYEKAFDEVKAQINFGNSFLLNLTYSTPICCNETLDTILLRSRAKYKVKYLDQFVCFSPETFIAVSADGWIRSLPMKGTIPADIPNASSVIDQDSKELAEHVTIVDLIRNDISKVATEVTVPRFRYQEHLTTSQRPLIQVSSEVRGKLSADWYEHVGTMLFSLLPAGSISGAPKASTVDIIKSVETHNRGFYTGVCGLFDGMTLDTGVMIRFIEKKGEQLVYKSGGGITGFSQAKKEYQEIIDKIYVPVY